MDFDLSEEQRMIREAVREFAQAEIAPRAREIDEKSEFLRDIFQKMGLLGLMGLPFPEEYGGAGADTISYALAVEEIAFASGSVATNYNAHISLGAHRSIFLAAKNRNKSGWFLWPEARAWARLP